MSTAATEISGVHQLKVTLAGVAPVVWRRLQVRSTTTLAELHEVLQTAMGWENYHLHTFQVGWDRFGGKGRAETRATLAEVLPSERGRMLYVRLRRRLGALIDEERILARERSAAATDGDGRPSARLRRFRAWPVK
jgi:hypothetical protein